MTFLKALGNVILTGVKIFAGFASTIQTGTTQVIIKGLSDLANLVVVAETVGQQQNISGPDRAKAIAPAVMQIILDTILKDMKIADKAMLLDGSADIAGGIAKCLNSVHHDSVNDVTTDVRT